MKTQFDDVTFYGQGLSTEAQQVLSDVSKAMQPWIEKSVQGLYDTVKQETDARVKDLEAAFQSTETLLTTMDQRLDALQTQLDQVPQMSAEKQIQQLAKLSTAVQGMKNWVDAENTKYRNWGKTLGNTALKVGATAVGVPPI